MMKGLNLKKIIFFLLFVCSLSQADAQNLNFEWVAQVGGPCGSGDEDDAVTSVAIDAAGNVYTSGYFCGTADFDPGPGTTYLASGAGANFIYKLDTRGNLVWVKTFEIFFTGITADSAGNVYAIGQNYNAAADFDPGANAAFLTTQGSFILKLNSAGDFVWVKGQAGSIGPKDIIIASNGDILTAGAFSGSADFDPGTAATDTFFATSNGSVDAYVSKFNSEGDFVWTRTFGSTDADIATAIQIDGSGNVYTTGQFKGTVDFDPATATTTSITATGYEDVFVSKFDASGNLVWAKAFLADGTLNQYNRVHELGLAVDATGNVYARGYIGGTVDFDPSATVNNLVSTGPNDFQTYVAKLDNQGNYLWAKKWGSFGYDLGSIALDAASNVYTTGVFENTVDFDPATATTTSLTCAGGCDIFVSKLTSNGDFVWAKAMGGLAYDKGYDIAVNRNGTSVYTAGSFATILGGQADFDPSANNNILTAGGTADGFVHKLSCSVYGSLIDTSCNNFTLNGMTYTASGIYTQAIPIVGGCDSVITLNITIDSIETGVTQQGAILTASAIGANYQWINCNGNTIIANATTQTYTATQNGSYAVIVTSNGCGDTSACLSVTIPNSVQGVDAQSILSVYPNPVNSQVNITFAHTLQDATIKLINIVGQTLIEQKAVSAKSLSFDLSKYTAGVYVLEVREGKEMARVKIVKQ